MRASDARKISNDYLRYQAINWFYDIKDEMFKQIIQISLEGFNYYCFKTDGLSKQKIEYFIEEMESLGYKVNVKADRSTSLDIKKTVHISRRSD